VISSQFTLEMCATADNRKKLKSLILGVEAMLIPLKSSSPELVMISSMSLPVCNRFHAKRANSGKIKSFRGYPSFMPSFEGNPLTQRHKILSQKTRVLVAATVKIS